jgi:hypothetical protein
MLSVSSPDLKIGLPAAGINRAFHWIPGTYQYFTRSTREYPVANLW